MRCPVARTPVRIANGMSYLKSLQSTWAGSCESDADIDRHARIGMTFPPTRSSSRQSAHQAIMRMRSSQ